MRIHSEAEYQAALGELAKILNELRANPALDRQNELLERRRELDAAIDAYDAEVFGKPKSEPELNNGE